MNHVPTWVNKHAFGVNDTEGEISYMLKDKFHQTILDAKYLFLPHIPRSLDA